MVQFIPNAAAHHYGMAPKETTKPTLQAKSPTNHIHTNTYMDVFMYSTKVVVKFFSARELV